MNIFVLSKNPRKCARYHANKHVVKMILESAQILCAVHVILDNVTSIEDTTLYKLTHKNHPCTIWARESSSNYAWLYLLFIALCEEYTFRYEKIHLCFKKFERVLITYPKNITRGKRTPFALAMPDDCKEEDAVQSYKKYYMTYKKHLCTWTKRKTPSWIKL